MLLTIENNRFGAINIAGKTHAHGVLICLSEDIKNRQPKLAKRVYGTSHILSLDEAKYIYEKGCEVMIFGSGQHVSRRFSPEADANFKKRACEVIVRGTPTAGRTFNLTKSRKIGVFHVTR